MKYPVYTQYKESGVAWLGEVPENWEVWKLSHGFQQTGSGTTPPSDNEDWYDGNTPWVTTSELRETVITDTTKKVSQTAIQTFSALKIFPKDSLAIAMYGATIGRLGIFGVPATTNQACCVMFGEKALAIRFSFYWFQAYREQIILLASGGGQPNISQEKIRSIRIACPKISEQTAIADFLDRETGRIDTLVAKKRKLVELLKEKRSALISRTVTCGLPADAAREFDVPVHNDFKSSGIEWLGDVPIGWGKARKLTHFASNEKNSFVNGPFGSDLLSSEITDQGVPVIYIRDISSGKYRRKSEGCVTEEKANQLKFCNVLPGDILIAKVGDPPGTAVVYPDNEPNAIVTQDVIRLRVDSRKVCAIYLAYFLNSSAGKGLIDQVAIDSTRMRVGLGDYKGSLAIFPPINEQSAISIYLDRETAKIDRLVEKVETAINRLQEYRSALITAAVTGKIDVREYV